MPQRQLPIFPAGVTEINSSIAVQKEKEQVWYIHGHLPVFHHHEEDVRSFRMFTSQMIVNGTVKPKEIVKAFGVPSITVKRYVKVFREQGVKGFYETKSRESSASVLKGEVLERARALLEQGRSVPDVSSELKVLANTLHKAIRAGRLPAPQKKRTRQHDSSHHQKRAQPERQPSADGIWNDTYAGAYRGGDGTAGIGANRISDGLRCDSRRSAAGIAGSVGPRSAAL
jgi:hypothetical protein